LSPFLKFVFCDFSKAFDKVWHKGLMHKIKSYGVDSNLLNWFSSYLQDRQQRVLITIVGVLLNILGENQIDIHKLTCFFVDG
jgi:hypothetical protein